MYSVNFKTDQALYEKFRIITTIKKEKLQNVLTKLIENYVTENEKLITNPEIQESIQATLPTFFGNADDWFRYVGKLDNVGYVNMVTRFIFFKFLLLNHKSFRHNNNGFLTFLEDKKDHFKKTDDFRYLAKFGIYRSVNDEAERYGADLLSVRSYGL